MKPSKKFLEENGFTVHACMGASVVVYRDAKKGEYLWDPQSEDMVSVERLSTGPSLGEASRFFDKKNNIIWEYDPGRGMWTEVQRSVFVSEADVKFLRRLKEGILSQDQRMTDDMYIQVQVDVRVYGMDEGYGEGFIYAEKEYSDRYWDEGEEDEFWEHVTECYPHRIKEWNLKHFKEKFLYRDEFLQEFGYRLVWFKVEKKMVDQVFFTEAAAKDYIERNRKNLNNPKLYGESFSNNVEMKRLRNIIINLKLDE